MKIHGLLLMIFFVAAGWAAGQEGREPQAQSLLGRDLYTPPLDEEAEKRLAENLRRARQELEADPADHDKLIWVGRRLAYLGRYRQAVEVYSDALGIHPDSPHLLRHRGHRYITLRQFDKAIADLRRAAELTEGKDDEVEPDGAPNPLGIPRSTLQTNIWYHLGLAHYLKGDFENSRRAYRECLERSPNDDMRVASSHWLYMSLRRLGREAEAAEVLEPIREEMDVIENHAYHHLLLLYKGVKTVEEILPDESDELQSATVGYGVGNWHLYNGRPEKAKEIFRRIVDQDGWAAFGYIASEAELARDSG